MTGELLRIGWALVVVLLVIVVFARLLAKRQGFSGSIPIQNLGYLGLGPKKAAVLLKVGREVLLIGLTQTEIKLLRVYPEEELRFENRMSEGLNKGLHDLKGIKKFLGGKELYNEKGNL